MREHTTKTYLKFTARISLLTSPQIAHSCNDNKKIHSHKHHIEKHKTVVVKIAECVSYWSRSDKYRAFVLWPQVSCDTKGILCDTVIAIQYHVHMIPILNKIQQDLMNLSQT